MEDNKPLEIPSRPPDDCSAEHLRTLRKRAQAALSTHRDRISKIERQVSNRLDEISSSLSEQWAADTAEVQQAEQTYEDAQRLREELEQAQQAWRLEQEEINAAIAARQHELDQLNAELDERNTKLEQHIRELDEREASLNKSQEEALRLRHDVEGQKSSWNDERTALEAERTELQQKFELALDDVRRIRSRAAELEQELARRPESEDDNDSAELVHLRCERDALAERVDELERQPAPQVDNDSKRQMTDLQRRFELAVEDVRELKTLNTKLEARLAEAERNVGHKADTGGMDWESQKQRMLSSLSEDVDGDDDPGTRRERATIEGTIRITDDVVAKKDDEIARLKEELSTLKPGSAEVDTDSQVNQLIDADEVIQQHRRRLAQLEKETEEKLRAAELELSIERAKLARKQVELNDWRAELESMQETRGKGDTTSSPGGPPKRRWLAKLGLGGDDEG